MIGAGRHSSRNIYPCFDLLKGALVVANADLNGERAKQIALQHGIFSSYTDYRKMLNIEQPDGVLVCVGPDFHWRVAIELMKMGYNVYTEKPPSVTAEQARKVLSVQKKTGKICMTGFKKRFAPAYVKARELICSDDFGELALLSILRTSGPYRNIDTLRSNYLLDSGIHAIDLATYLYDSVASVSAIRKTPGTFSITLQFVSGSVGTLSLTDRMSYARGLEQVTAIGTKGVCVQVDNSVEMLAFKKDKPIAAHKPEFVAGTSNSFIEMGFVGELQAFVDAIASGTQPKSNIVNSAHTMSIIEAIERSAETGIPISVEKTE